MKCEFFKESPAFKKSALFSIGLTLILSIVPISSSSAVELRVIGQKCTKVGQIVKGKTGVNRQGLLICTKRGKFEIKETNSSASGMNSDSNSGLVACTKAGESNIRDNKKFTCVKSGEKLVWDKGILLGEPAVPQTPVSKPQEPKTPAKVSICPASPYFNKFPIDLAEIKHISAFGGFSPPGHVMPTGHLGVYLKNTGVTLRAPADMHLWNLRRVTYLASPNRQGLTDWAVEFKLCDTLVGLFGHITTLSPTLMAHFKTPLCSQYSTSDETVEACRQENIVGVDIKAGDVLGTVGGPSAGAFDFDFYDYNHNNVFVNINRVAFLNRHAICALEHFGSVERELLLSRVSADGMQLRDGEPRCGTVNVDVAGTAQGLWVTKANPVNQGSNETPFVVLALDPGQPKIFLALSVGVPELGARLYRFPQLHSGRVNRAYAEIKGDDLIYCYDSDRNVPTTAILLSLSAAGVLTLEKVEPVNGKSICAQAPASWAHTSAAVAYIR